MGHCWYFWHLQTVCLKCVCSYGLGMQTAAEVYLCSLTPQQAVVLWRLWTALAALSGMQLIANHTR